MREPLDSSVRRGVRLQNFLDLARIRIQNILLVSSLYDSFILAEDGPVGELIAGASFDLGGRQPPALTRVSTGSEALALASQPYDLIIASLNTGDMDGPTFARRARAAGITTPIVLLGYDAREVTEVASRAGDDVLHVFLWQGDTRILPTIVRVVEDRLNVAHDTGECGVQLILVVEDSIRFYSSFLPVMYSELITHAFSVMPDGANLSQRLSRLQARPRILLSRSFETALADFDAYEADVLGVICDVEFARNGRVMPEAGVAFASLVRGRQPDVPVVLQSSRTENEGLARAVGADFLLKNSPTFLGDLRRVMVDSFFFGEFIFRLPDGMEVGRANDLRALEDELRRVPVESVAFHAERNHFSRWLKARTEFALAQRLRGHKVSDFPTLEDLRWTLVDAVRDYRQQRGRGIVIDFDRTTFDATTPFARVGGGSLGGKARGLAFINYLLSERGVRDRFGAVPIAVPPCVVIGTDVFDEFLERNDLREFALHSGDDAECERRLMAASLPGAVMHDLASVVKVVSHPLAIRSSSLLEDSHYQPFAGIYETEALANADRDAGVRLWQLAMAIKRIYASTFSARARGYLATTPYRLEEEKMAVIVQKLVGRLHGDRFYPHFSGVARSHNFYPVAPMRADEGIAAVALGFGESVVTGRPCLRFCPRHPRRFVQFSSVQDLLENSQRDFFALPLAADGSQDDGSELRLFSLADAERDGTLAAVGSTYSPENDVVYDDISRAGVRLVTFAPVLKHGLFPLAEILDLLLAVSVEGTGVPVEIEFSATLGSRGGPESQFDFLQVRPLVVSREAGDLAMDEANPSDLICQSASVLGNGRFEVHDLVVVDFHRFERGHSHAVARDVARYNAVLQQAERPYVLIGVGRWGSLEPFLGIPVAWGEIAGARAIVEAGFRDFRVTPSQGTHFFQNLSASSTGYFTVNPEVGEGFVDWDWLAAQPAAETGVVRHLQFDAPVVVTMNGRTQRGIIAKPR